MHPFRFWFLFLGLTASATVFFPQIADARPIRSIARDTSAAAKPRSTTVKTPIVKIGRAYRAEIKPKVHKAKRK